MENQQQPTEQQSAAVKKTIWAGVKEAAREVIGQPKPTRVRGSRKGGRRGDGRHRAGVTGALDIYAPQEQEYISGSPRMATNPALHGAAITSIPSRYLHDVRQRKHEKDTLYRFSREAIVHADFLLHTQGKAAMDEYLKQIKERRMDRTEHVVETQKLVETRKQQNVTGGIEELVLEAEAKAKHFREEIERLEKEADQQDQIALKLREALGVMNGTAGKPAKERTGHGEWQKRLKAILVTPMRKNDLIKEITKLYQVKNNYGLLAKATERGWLTEKDGKITYTGE